MPPVAIVTDSTAGLTPEMIRGLNIHVAPLQVIWDQKSHLDGIDIHPSEFYQRLNTSKSMPTTSQVTPGLLNELYSSLIEHGNDVLSIHLSSKLSGTIDSAIQARNMLPGAHIELQDSLSTSMAMGFVVLSVARAAAQGATLKECKILAEQAQNHIGVLFAVKTLEFLHRGGRIGGAAAFVGTALSLKPILELRDGRIEAIERVRTMSKALDRLLDLFEDRVGPRRPVHIASLHANAPEVAQLLLEKARERFSTSEVSSALCTEISPVLGTHTGPGTIGLAFMSGM